MQAGPARYVSHVRVESWSIGEQSNYLEVVLSARPVYGKTTVEINEVRKLSVGLQTRSDESTVLGVVYGMLLH